MAVFQVTSAPAAEPILRTEAKNWLKISSTVTADDDLVDALIKDAREYVERVTGRALITQTITEYWDGFPEASAKHPRVIFPHVAPVQSVTSLAYIATGSTPSTYTVWDNTSNAKYWLDSVSGMTGIGPARIIRNSDVEWPEVAEFMNCVRVVYVAGYGASGASVPGPLKEAIKRLVGLWYYGRKGSTMDDFKMVDDLLNPYKVHK